MNIRVLGLGDDAIYYIIMNMSQHIVHHISVMSDLYLMFKKLETPFASSSKDLNQLLDLKLTKLIIREGKFINNNMRTLKNPTIQFSDSQISLCENVNLSKPINVE